MNLYHANQYVPELANEFVAALRRIPAGIVRRAIHVGAHAAEEAGWYRQCGIFNTLWIEANPFLFPHLEAVLVGVPNQRALLALVADHTGELRDFHVLSNGHSSSLLRPQEHLQVYPHVREITTLQLRTITLDDLLATHDEREPFNVLILDVQGAESLVLCGAQRTLQNVQVLQTEINFRELYRGAVLAETLDAELQAAGFHQVAKYDTGSGWGEAIYVKGSH